MQKYGILLEVSGSFGMFARPDTGSDACSYPIPPASACLGMIQSICRVVGTKITIAAVGVCDYPCWGPYAFNSYSPIRHPTNIKQSNACQTYLTVLENPRYQILAYVTNEGEAHPNWPNVNSAHSFQSQFHRRLEYGQSFRNTCLGLKEFMASYVGFPRTPIFEKYNATIASFVHGDYANSSYYNSFRSNTPLMNAKVKNGVFQFPNNIKTEDKEDEVKVENGILQFANPTNYRMWSR